MEEFHRTWKRGECNIEDSQLRSVDAVAKWATIMAAVATRIERLKYSSRHKPDEPATLVLTTTEIEVLLHDQRQRAPKGARFRKKPIELVTIAEATHWIALMGGWIVRPTAHQAQSLWPVVLSASGCSLRGWHSPES